VVTTSARVFDGEGWSFLNPSKLVDFFYKKSPPTRFRVRSSLLPLTAFHCQHGFLIKRVSLVFLRSFPWIFRPDRFLQSKFEPPWTVYQNDNSPSLQGFCIAKLPSSWLYKTLLFRGAIPISISRRIFHVPPVFRLHSEIFFFQRCANIT